MIDRRAAVTAPFLPPPSTPDGPPPPPPATRGDDDGGSRATAATWVAGVGALLLLASAGTFLAVRWDALGTTARVAVVAAVTAAAIVGGHRLRAVLPAVGSVVFHLGALLLPVDALGLALQLDAEVAVRWLAVGATAIVLLPPLAVAGRSRSLAFAAVLGVPVLATGVGLVGGPPAPLTVAAAAVLALGGSMLLRGRVVVGTSAPAASLLASVAIHVPIVLAVVVAALPTAPVVGARDAGWVPATWAATAAWGALAVLVLAVGATLQRSTRLALLTLAGAVVAAVSTLVPDGTPRLVVLLGVPTLALVLELAAAGLRSHALWGRPIAVVALLGELLAAPAALVVAVGDVRFGSVVDTELAAGLAVAALAWVVACLRRVPSREVSAAWAPALLGVATVHLAAAVSLAGAPGNVVTVVFLLGALSTLAWTELGRGARVPASPAHLAALTAVALVAAAAWSAVDVGGTLVAVGVGLAVLGTHARQAIAGARPDAAALTWLLLPAALGLAVVALLSPTEGGARLVGLVVALVGVAALAAAVDRVAGAGDAMRVAVAVIGCTALLPTWPSPVFRAAGNVVGLEVVLGLRLLPTALVPALLAGVLLAIDAARTRRVLLAVVLAPLIVRGVVAGSLAGGRTVTGSAVVLLAVAVAAGLVLVVGPSRVRPPAAALALVGGPVGVLLVGDARLVRAGVLLAVGALLVVAGTVRRQPAIGHAGGVVGVLGIWDLLLANDVGALDVWLLPAAVHLWVASDQARRSGSLRSSWVVDVPPLLLVAVPAVFERLAGGGGWHAVLAGVLALGAVVLGGVRRGAGPLVVGTVLLVVLVAVEVFAVVAAVPTWVWLAVGGLALLAAAALIERHGGTPARAARRLLDVVSERFD